MASKDDNLTKAIDKSKNTLQIITDKNGSIKKVWKHNESVSKTDAGKNAGKSYEKSGKRHTSYGGFDAGDEILFTAGGKEIKGIFRHVNQSKHSTVAVVRGEDNRLYERGLSKITKAKLSKVDEDFDESWDLEDLKKLHKKLFSNIDISLPKSDTEKRLDKLIAKKFSDINQKIREKHEQSQDGLDVFRNVVKVSRDLKHAFELVSKMKNVNPETSQAFKSKYGSNGERPIEAFENFYNEVKGIKKDSLHIETQKLDKKNNPRFGGKKEENFTDSSDKVTWKRGDTVTFIDKNNKEKTGRVFKVDDELNTTTIRLASGMVETISNKKVKS